MPPECANPLLLEWLKEWSDAARERNTKGFIVYKKAYDSVKACPLTFNHPSEAQQLHGLGPKLCDRLTEKLKAHCAEQGLPMPEPPYKARKRKSGDVVTGTAPAKKPRKLKPYVPQLRSGTYALIFGLSSLPEDSPLGLTKAQTIEAAQPHCDSSFTAPSDPTKFYTAWSSMKTLIEKDLVYERGRPLRKYALTDDGWEVAKRIKNIIEESEPELGEAESFRALGPVRAANQNSDLGHRLDDDQSIRRRISGQPSVTRLERQVLVETTNMKQRVKEPSRAKTATSTGFRKPPKPVLSSDDYIELLSSPVQPIKRKATESEIIGGGNKALADQTLEALIGPSRAPTQDQEPQPFPPIFEPHRIAPGNFTVQLILDNREVRAKNDRDYIASELTKKGITPIVRPLELGDALWVAKCHDPQLLSRYGEEGDEIVLDWIVERKRLDDLVGSIKDGRFHEQKFRLRKSGVKNVVYVVEEISMNLETAQKYHEAVMSAIASTQIVNGYFVKRTGKLDETIRYLARMTVMLKGLYESSPLHLIPTPHLHPTTYLPLVTHLRTTQPQKNYHITYPSFSSLSSKSDSLTLRDVFLKMLMCTRGVTGDKALEIQKVWNTPRKFIEAFESCGGGSGSGGVPAGVGTNREAREKERKKMVMDRLGGLVARRKVGKVLSAKVAEVWAET